MVIKKLAVSSILIVAVLFVSVGYAIFRSVFVVPGACISEDLQTVPNLSGTRVEVVYTNCDALAKEEAISVYFSRASVERESWFAKWQNHRKLVFSYDPLRSDRQPPTIANPSRSTILISVPEVSSIIYKNKTWRDKSIEYAIGKSYSH
jgi:hypothetical protein